MKLRQLLLACVIAPLALTGQPMVPPAQEYVLHFQPAGGMNGVAYTAQISLGATFTMESWVFLKAASPFSVIMGKTNNPRGSDPFHNYILGFEQGGRIPAFVQTTGQPGTFRRITGTSELPLYAWTHLAAVLDSGVMRLYVNGQLVASGASPGPPGGAAVPFGLGAAIPDGTSVCCAFSGAMREARVWSRGLTSSELQTYATQKLTGTEIGLIANWPLSEGSGQVVHGIGSQAATLTIQGSAIWIKTQLLDGGPYWEIQDLPKLTDTNYGAQAALFLNTDHRPDILIAYTPYDLIKPTAGPVLFLHNEGNRVFTPVKPAQPSGMVWPRNSTAADLDGDGFEDVVVADHGYDAPPYPGGITRIFMQRSGEMKDETDSRLPPGPAFTHDVCSADVNGDGSPDLFFASLHSGGTIQGPILYLNDGYGHFRAANELLPPIFSTSSAPTFLSCRFVDVNRDGAPDLVLGTWHPQDVRDELLLNDGKGNLRDVTALAMPPKRGGPGWATLGFAEGDVNRDGWPDLIVSIQENANNGLTSTMQLLINNRDGTFHDQPDTALNIIRTDGFFDKTFALDLNQDGWLDLVAEQNHFGVRLYQNVGGHFEERTETLPTGTSGARPRTADFDGDDRIDIALFSGNKTRIAWGKNLWPAVCHYAASVGGWAFAGQGGSGSVDITTTPDCQWTVSGLPGWVQVTNASSGSGSATVTFQAAANAGAALSGTFTIAGQTFTVEQQAASTAGLNFAGSMAHIASAGTWKTTFDFINLGVASANARISFFGDNGSSLPLPLTFPQAPPTLGPLVAASFDRVVSAGASLVIESTGPDAQATSVGWSQLLTGGNISGFAIFSNPLYGWDAVVPMESRNAASYLLAFDNTGVLATGLAIANLVNQNADIPVIVRNSSGIQIGSFNLALLAMGHTSFMLKDVYPITVGLRGTIEFQTPPGGWISILGLRANGPSVTTLPVLANVGTNGGSITHALFNGEWTAGYTLVNIGATAASATLSFFAQNGSGLSVPLSLPHTSSVRLTVTGWAASHSSTGC